MGRVVRVCQVGDARGARDDLLNELEFLAGQVWAIVSVAGDVPARTIETRDEPGTYRVAAVDHDRDGASLSLRGPRRRRSERDDQVNLCLDQLRSEAWESLRLVVGE